MIQRTTLNELQSMTGHEGLILQGCGGDPQEWLDGINDLLSEEGILLNNSLFREASVFDHGGLTNILFHMKDDVELDIGKLAIWRLQTSQQFGGTWLSDYLPNCLGNHEDDTDDMNEDEDDWCQEPEEGEDFSEMGGIS